MATINTDLIVPEVYSELVRDKIPEHCVVSQFLVNKGDLMNEPGETVYFDKWGYIGDAADWDINTPMPTTKMSQTKTPATVKAIAAPAVEVHDYDNEVALGDALEEAAEQQAIAIARKQDSDACACALTSPLKLKLQAKNTVTWQDWMNAFLLFGDDIDTESFDGIIVHSLFLSCLYGLPEFVSREITHTTDNNGIVRNGLVGYLRGIPVYVSDRLYDTTNQEGYALIMKKSAIGIIPHEKPLTEASRIASVRKTILYTSQFYAMALTDDTAVVYMKTVI